MARTHWPVRGLVERAGDLKTFRILCYRAEAAAVGLVRVDGARERPRWHSEIELLDQLHEGTLRVTVDRPRLAVGSAKPLTERQTAVYNERANAIRPLVLDTELPKLCDESGYPKAVRERATEVHRSGEFIALTLHLYFVGGMVNAALVPTFGPNEKPGTIRPAGTAKRGRPSVARTMDRLSASEDGNNVDDDMREKIVRGAKRFYFGRLDDSNHEVSERDRATRRRAYQLTLRQYFAFTKPEVNSKGFVDFKLAARYPSFAQFCYWGIDRFKDSQEAILRRRGQIAINQKHRSAIGSPALKLSGPGAVYQIDACMLRVHLVSRRSRLIRVGRPWLYFVRDQYSGAIVGVALSLSPPSFETAAVAVRNTIRNKVEFCREFELSIDSADWSAEGAPTGQLTADRGELLGQKTDRLVMNFGFTIANLPGLRPDWKGGVERSFGIIEGTYLVYEPGAVVKDYRERPALRDEPALTLNELYHQVILFVLDFNRQLLPLEDRDAGLDELGIGPISREEAFAWGVANRTGRFQMFSGDELDWRVLPIYEATPADNGFLVHGLRYQVADPIPDEMAHLHLRALGRKKMPVTLAIDPSNVGRAWLLHPHFPVAVRCRLRDGDERFDGHSKEEVLYRLAEFTADAQVLAPAKLEGTLGTQAAMAAITGQAVKELRALTDAGMQAPAVSIPAAREAERLLASIAGVRPTDEEQAAPAPKADIIDLGAHLEKELFQ